MWVHQKEVPHLITKEQACYQQACFFLNKQIVIAKETRDKQKSKSRDNKHQNLMIHSNTPQQKIDAQQIH